MSIYSLCRARPYFSYSDVSEFGVVGVAVSAASLIRQGFRAGSSRLVIAPVLWVGSPRPDDRDR